MGKEELVSAFLELLIRKKQVNGLAHQQQAADLGLGIFLFFVFFFLRDSSQYAPWQEAEHLQIPIGLCKNE